MSKNKVVSSIEGIANEVVIDLEECVPHQEEIDYHVENNQSINLSIKGSFAGLLSLFAGENSHLNITYVTFNDFPELNIQCVLSKGAKVNFAMADFGHGQGKVTVLFRLKQRDAEAHWRLSTLTSQHDHKTYTVSFTHEAPHTYSKMENYGVVYQDAQLRFTGVSHIQTNAPKSEAHQFARIMVFDERSVGKVEPVLKIDHDDVAASHAATVGKVSDEHLYYLCSRGLSLREAKNLITAGYLKPIIASFTDVDIREQIYKKIEEQEDNLDA